MASTGDSILAKIRQHEIKLDYDLRLVIREAMALGAAIALREVEGDVRFMDRDDFDGPEVRADDFSRAADYIEEHAADDLRYR